MREFPAARICPCTTPWREAVSGTDAFQEIDAYGLALPITKHSVLVKSAAEFLVELPRAFEIVRSGRPGPVIVDVPAERPVIYAGADCAARPFRRRPLRRSRVKNGFR